MIARTDAAWNSGIPDNAMLAIAAGPSIVGRGSRLRWIRMWIDTGIPRSAAARKNSSSAGETSSPPAGHAVMMQPRAPISRQRSSSAIASLTPRFGIWARKNSRSGSAAQNSCAM
jgi:hypothetical protein